MDQTGVCIDNTGRLTIDVRGAKHVNVVQGMGENGARCSVFLCASALGKKLSAFVVFSGVPGADVYTEVSDPNWGHSDVVHTTQRKAWCNHAEEVCTPTADGCRMLMMDSLRVHKMESVKQHLEDTYCTKVQYVPPGIAGLTQPMDVSVMRYSEKHTVRVC
ncbi:hypothetical protein PC119_g5932 [Phytophthora cactorum]|nr:hypothetical protein PC119_g5932 [Phytophthora cactorum]KAG3189263.1 hypothetical protein PC128_g11816 [Phytophthora cactorum]KAG4056530.1 hypothetical protein PC123_g8404 [Phytophthora cactorum]